MLLVQDEVVNETLLWGRVKVEPTQTNCVSVLNNFQTNLFVMSGELVDVPGQGYQSRVWHDVQELQQTKHPTASQISSWIVPWKAECAECLLPEQIPQETTATEFRLNAE